MTKTIMIKMDNGIGDRNCEVVVSESYIVVKWRNGDCSINKQVNFSELSLSDKDLVSSKLLKSRLNPKLYNLVSLYRTTAGLQELKDLPLKDNK